MSDEEWVYTTEIVTREQIEALNRLLSIRADESLVVRFDEDGGDE
jgi:hypothetical protein